MSTAGRQVTAWLARVRERPRPLLVGEVAVVLLLVGLYDRIRDVATTRAEQATGNAWGLLRFESWLHIDPERAMNSWLARYPTLEWVSCWYYQAMHLTVTLGLLVWLYVRRAGLYRAARNALVLVNAIGLVVFWLLPMAPPRLLAGFVDSGVVTGVAENVAHVSPNVYAAMPSLHVGWMTWVLLQVWTATTSRTGRGLAAGHAVLTVLVVLATANHFVLDVVAGAAVGALATGWSRLERRVVEERELVPAT